MDAPKPKAKARPKAEKRMQEKLGAMSEDVRFDGR